MGIYTKKGDKGETALIGGKRVSKCHIRVEAYGSVDELNSYLGLIRDQDINNHYKEILLKIQNKLFVIESLLACDSTEIIKTLQKINEADIKLLENEIDIMVIELTELSNFILPGGHTIISYCHIARCICRRVERIIVQLNQVIKFQDQPH